MYNRNEITIIDNFLDTENWESIKDLTMGPTFKWTCGPSLMEAPNVEITMDPLYDRQLVNLLYSKYKPSIKSAQEQESDYKIIIPILKKLRISTKELTRVKINGNLCRATTMRSGWHVDVPDDQYGLGMTAIYYINTNNGKTLFKTGEEIESIENRIVIFPNHFFHSPQYQTDTPMRCVININWSLDTSSET
ncbi:MAG: hypothetical protein ACO3CD_02755 [Candidatus Nanopelagicaceae bacterium]